MKEQIEMALALMEKVGKEIKVCTTEDEIDELMDGVCIDLELHRGPSIIPREISEGFVVLGEVALNRLRELEVEVDPATALAVAFAIADMDKKS